MPSTADTPRTIAIGDIHGCIHALDTILDAINPQTADTLVVLGDFIDQGHDSADVIDRLIALREHCNLVTLMGNHEEMLLAAVNDEKTFRYWFDCGGFATLNSYRFGAKIGDVPDDHIQFIRACDDYFETETAIFVHANFDPALPLAEQPTRTLRWELLDERPNCHYSGKTVVLGHTEQASGEVFDAGCVKCIDTSCWKHGWLTALSVDNGEVWQASRFGSLREIDEAPVGPIAPPND